MSLIGMLVIIICVIVVVVLISGAISLINGISGFVKDRHYMRGEPIHFNYGGRRITAYVRKIKKRGDKTYHIVVDKH